MRLSTVFLNSLKALYSLNVYVCITILEIRVSKLRFELVTLD